MRRRTFLGAAAVAAGGSLVTAQSVESASSAGDRRMLELRAYQVKSGQRERLDRYLQEGLLPALGRLKYPPTGVFDETTAEGETVVWVLIRHQDAGQCVRLTEQLAADAVHEAAAVEFLSGPKESAVYDRIETSLLASFGPDWFSIDPSAAKQPRIFNLRIYESFNSATLRKKIEMFEQGELDIFERVGLSPVFFSETIAGPRLPSITYLLTFPDDDARQAAWQTFRGDAEWQRLKAIPEYADVKLVSRITNILLTPVAYSQI
ncbi:MAG: NIPSNAP family protein [Planctomycetaceae bacterium]